MSNRFPKPATALLHVEQLAPLSLPVPRHEQNVLAAHACDHACVRVCLRPCVRACVRAMHAVCCAHLACRVPCIPCSCVL
eukprot:5560838-Alexandrium_andersonii.AAC.1